jgi:hypothetical protein
MVSVLNLDDSLVGVVFLVCLARVVQVGGIKRPRDVIAIAVFADDDEHVMHLTPVDRWAEFLDRVNDEAVRVVGVQRDRMRNRFAAVPNMGLGHKGSPAWCRVMHATIGKKWQ